MRITLSRMSTSIIFILVGMFFLYGSWEACLDYMRIKNYTEQAIADVIKKQFTQASDGNTNYSVYYKFVPVDGTKEIIASSNILKQQWDLLKEGDKLAIRYNASNHENSIVINGANASPVLAFFLFILGSVFLFFGIGRLIK